MKNCVDSHAPRRARCHEAREADRDPVQADYLQYLQRPADPAGLAGWLTHLQQGMSDQTLTANLLGSNEFFNAM
jgi:hypothetical protein